MKITSPTSFQSYSEALADIAFNCGFALCDGTLFTKDSREFVQLMIEWAKEFEEKHKDQDWIDVDYILAIDRFTHEKIFNYHAKTL